MDCTFLCEPTYQLVVSRLWDLLCCGNSPLDVHYQELSLFHGLSDDIA